MKINSTSLKGVKVDDPDVAEVNIVDRIPLEIAQIDNNEMTQEGTFGNVEES